jgi:GntR family transcriptional regulator / MocR family aminotransferase
MVPRQVAANNSHLTAFRYDHYDQVLMKKAPSGILPLITVDKGLPQSLYQQIYDGHRKAILDGTLRAGQRLPSTRILAGELGVSRVPVLSAYEQLLAEGYLESRVGSGTVVSRSLPRRAVSVAPAATPSTRDRSRRKVSKRAVLPTSRHGLYGDGGLGPFRFGQVAFEQFPLRIWNSLVTRQGRRIRASSLKYGDHMGLGALREAIAAHIRAARAVRCEAGQIMIVGGSQLGLEITTRALLDPASPVWVEEPGYTLARAVLEGHGCRIVPVPVDAEGLDVAAGMRKCHGARAALVTPSHQFPLGVAMSATRRLQLLDWAQSSGAWIIEDDYDSEFRYQAQPIASLQGLDRNARVVYIGTFSKVLFPSLRLGYVVVPPDLIDRFLAVRFAMDVSSPTFLQAVVADFIGEGHFARHIRRMRSVYAERRDALIESVANELGGKVEVVGAQAGMHLTAILKAAADREVAGRAARQNLWLAPLSAFYAHKAARQGFVLGFGSTPAEAIPAAVRRLRACL